MKKPLFTGVCTALVTPFLGDKINEPMLKVLLSRQIQAGVDAVVLAGTTGESPTLSDEENYEDKTMVDYSAGDISTKEAHEIIKTVEENLGNEIYKFYGGVSYRHCLVWQNGTTDLGEMTPPHDISGKVIGSYLSDSQNAKPLIDLMKKSYDILVNHPINVARKAAGLNPANSAWFWGAGTRPALASFEEKTGKKGMMVSAVDLLKGIAVGAGMGVAVVEGANGGLHTNYEGKVEAAVKAVTQDGYDLLHFSLKRIRLLRASSSVTAVYTSFRSVISSLISL